MNVFRDEFFNELYLARESMKELEDIDSVLILLEAEDATDEVKDKVIKNDVVQGNVIDHIKKAIAALLKTLAGFASEISNKLSGNGQLSQKNIEEKIEEAKEAIKEDPELKEKTYSVRNYEEEAKKIDSKINELQTIGNKIKDSSGYDVNKIVEGALLMGKDIGRSSMTAVKMETMLNMAANYQSIAIRIKESIQEDEKLIREIEKNISKKDAEQFRREINFWSKNLVLRKTIAKLKKRKFDSLSACVSDVLNGMVDLSARMKNPRSKKLLKRLNNSPAGQSVVDAATALYTGNLQARRMAGQDVDKEIRRLQKNGNKEARKLAKRESRGDYSKSPISHIVRHEVEKKIGKVFGQ